MVIPSRARGISTSTGNFSVTKVKKTRVFLEYPCYICGDMLSRVKNAIDHTNRIHGFDIPARLQGRKRPQDNHYKYIRDRNVEVDEMHYSCASCWFHCPEDDNGIQALNAHVRQEHNPIKVDDTKGGDDVTQVGSRESSRRGSSIDPDGVQCGSGNANRGRNQINDSRSGDKGKTSSDQGRNEGGTSSNDSQSDDDDSEREESRSVTPMTEEGANEIASKLDELTNLFKQFFFQ